MRSRPDKIRSLPERYKAGFLSQLDKRSGLSQRMNFSFNALCEDLGGIAAMPYSQQMIAERATFLEEVCRRLEVTIVEDPVKHRELLGKWSVLTNSLIGATKLLGVTKSKADAILDSLYLDVEDEPDE